MQRPSGCHAATGLRQRLAAVFLSVSALLVACGGASGESANAYPVAGTRSGEFLYPEFQRWRIVNVVTLPDAKIPMDASGVRTILMGRSIYLGRGYFTVPFLNADGEVMMSACFKPTDTGLEGIPVSGTGSEYGLPLTLRFLDKGQMSTELYGMWEATLVREDVQPGDEPAQDSFDRGFNRRLEREARMIAKAPCEIKPATLATLVNGPLEFVAPDSGRRLVVPDADLDVRTPALGYGASQESRRPLDPALPANKVAGCTGEVFIMRIHSGEADDKRSRTEYRLTGSLFGTDSRGALCARPSFLRRLDPERLQELLALPPTPPKFPGLDIPGETPLRLTRWVEDGVFRATLGEAEIEVTVFEKPTVHVTLISAPPPKAEPVAVEPAAAVPPRRQELRLPARAPAPAYEARLEAEYVEEPDSGPGDEIHRWVDENGVVHYSDLPGPQ